MNKPLYPIVRVQWVDSCASSGWTRFSEVTDAYWRASNCETVGYLIKKNKHTIVLALSIGVDAGTADFTEVMRIPRVAVKKMKVLK